MKGALATVEICGLRGWRFLNHFDIESETPYTCYTVGSELWRVTVYFLLYTSASRGVPRPIAHERKYLIDYKTSSNHRLGSAGLNAFQ